MESFEKSIAIAVKKSQTKDALLGIRDNEDYSNNIAITYFQAQDYNLSLIHISEPTRPY